MTSPQQQTAVTIRQRKGKDPIACLTCHSFLHAQLLDPHVDILLVGDTLGMTVYGMETTLSVTLDLMIAHGKAVVRGAKRALVVVDMPFASYQESPEHAYRNAARMMSETGCGAIKLEGGSVMKPTISFLVERGIPVMAHVGVMPQSVHTHGGYRFVGRDIHEGADAKAHATMVEHAGAFAVVLECVEQSTAHDITKNAKIPTIGIGSSQHCDGQVLVLEDMLGLPTVGVQPRFVKQYAKLAEDIGLAAQTFTQDVKKRAFPEEKHSFMMQKK